MNRYVLENKFCEWCGTNFIPIKGQQSDMCRICWNRYKLYLSIKKSIADVNRQLEYENNCLVTVINQYKELASQGYKIPEDLEVKK